MYKSKELIEEITYNLNLIQLNITSFSKMNLYDLNIYSEDFFCKLLNIIFDLNLKNLNLEDKNIASIDLGDIKTKICYQITSTAENTKIKSTIEKFEKFKLYNKYDNLFILLLTNKKDYRSDFNTNKKYNFSKDNIYDLNSLIQFIKAKDYNIISQIHEFIYKNMKSFIELKSINKKIQQQEEDINSILLQEKENALQKYNLTSEIVKNTLIEIDPECRSGITITDDYCNISEDNLKIIHRATLFFESMNENRIKRLSKFIKIHNNVLTKFATSMFIEHYNKKNRVAIYPYLFENILRVLTSLKSILNSEINISFSTGFGDYQELIGKDYLIVSVSNSEKNDNKLIFLDINKDITLGYKFCLGGTSEKVDNIKSYNNYILANSNKNIYLWNPVQSHSNPLILSKVNYIISDYEVFELSDKTT